MSETFTLDAKARQDVGKGASRRLRKLNDQIPAIVYGAGKPAQPLTLDHNKVLAVLKNEAFYSSILKLNIDGKAESVVLKDMQRHPYKPKIEHMDFLRIKANEKLTMSVPLHFLNEESCKGVKEGGMISHLMTEVEIRCLPKNLPEYLALDLTNLELDQTLHLSDLTLPEGVEILALTHDDPQDAAVVSVHIQKAAAESEETAGSEDSAESGDTEKSNDANKSE